MSSSALAALHAALAADHARPVAFRDVGELPWADPDVGRRFLRVGRRNEEQTHEEVGFLVDVLDLTAPGRVLDLMCGDGRIALPLARHGLEVVGVDVNGYAVEQARRTAEAEGTQTAQFVVGDARDLSVDGPFDAAMVIFGHFSGFPREVGATMLRRVRELVPDGRLLLDMHLGPAAVRELDGQRDWTLWEEGWLGGDGPALVLDDYCCDGDALTFVRRSYCLDLERDALTVWGQSGQFYDLASMTALLRETGWCLERCWGEFDQRPYDDASSPNLIALAF